MLVRRSWIALRARWSAVVAAGLVGLILAGILLVAVPPAFSSTTRLHLGVVSAGSRSALEREGAYAAREARSLALAVRTRTVLVPAARTLGVSAARLSRGLQASVPSGTTVIVIRATAESPDLAARAAVAVGSRLGTVVRDLGPTRDGRSALRLDVLDPPAVPSAPDGPGALPILLAGLGAGLLVGIAGTLVVEAVRRPVRTADDVAAAVDAPVLGTIVVDRTAPRHPVPPADSLRGEQYRQLRAALHGTGRGRRIVVTSALPRGGTSTVAVNLALALARAGADVCLVDANLRAPAVARMIGVPDVTGLTSVVRDEMDVRSALTSPEDEERLSVLPSGPPVPDASGTIESPRLEEALAQLEREFEWVVIDAPALLAASEALALSDAAGGAYLVAASGTLRADQLRDAAGMLESGTSDPLGVILNKVPMSSIPVALRHAYGLDADEVRPPGLEPGTH